LLSGKRVRITQLDAGGRPKRNNNSFTVRYPAVFAEGFFILTVTNYKGSVQIKTMRIIVVLLIVFFLGCTNTIHVSSKADTIYPPHCTIAVSCDSDDLLSIRQQAEYLLASKGFKVVSERVARMKANIQNRQYTFVASKEGTFPKRSEEMPSIYILHFSYEYYSVKSYRAYSIKKFSASLVDLTNGNVVASADSPQGCFGAKTILSVIVDFVNKLSDLG